MNGCNADDCGAGMYPFPATRILSDAGTIWWKMGFKKELSHSGSLASFSMFHTFYADQQLDFVPYCIELCTIRLSIVAAN